MNLRSMSIDKLAKLKDQVDAALSSKVVETRRMLESQLSKLTGFGTTSRRGPRGVRGKVAPKYRNPANPSETWAGRGLKPRWLVAGLKSGKKLEYFSIDKATPRKAAAKKAKPVRKVRKTKARKARASRPASAPSATATAAQA